MWLLVRRPGQLSVDYLRGRRVPLVSPLRLFVFVSIVYFVSLTLLHAIPLAKAPNIQFNTFATPLSTQLHGNDFYGAYAARQVEQKLRRDQIGYPDLERRYNEKTTVLSKTLVFVLIPVIALLFGALFFRKRRFIAEHLSYRHTFLGVHAAADWRTAAGRVGARDLSLSRDGLADRPYH